MLGLVVFFQFISFELIPWPSAAVAHVDAIEQECEGSGIEPYFAVIDIRRLGP
jgi:hypothetical protein